MMSASPETSVTRAHCSDCAPRATSLHLHAWGQGRPARLLLGLQGWTERLLLPPTVWGTSMRGCEQAQQRWRGKHSLYLHSWGQGWPARLLLGLQGRAERLLLPTPLWGTSMWGCQQAQPWRRRRRMLQVQQRPLRELRY